MIFLVILGVFFIYFGLTPDIMSNYFIGFMLICFGTTLLQIQKQPPEPIRQTLSILSCTLCGLTKVRNFQNGDFVYKKLDNCGKCNEQMEISKIYSVKLKKSPAEPKKKVPQSPKKS